MSCFHINVEDSLQLKIPHYQNPIENLSRKKMKSYNIKNYIRYKSDLKAKLKKLPNIAPKNINSQSVKSKLNILKPDLMILVGYSAGLLKKEIYDLARKSYLVAKNDGDGGKYDMIHTENFVLVDKEKRIRGFYDGTNQSEMDKLLNDIRILENSYLK